MSVLNKLENAKVEVKVTVEDNIWKEAQKKAFNKIAKNVEIKGFRKGQAPKHLLNKYINEQNVYLEAVEAVAQNELVKAIDEHKLELIDRPELKIDTVNADVCELTFVCPVKPDVTLGEYKGLGYKVTKPRITAKEVDAEVEAMRERKADLELKEDGVVEDGDTAVIDFEGFKDGVAFEGGKGENHNLVIGSGSFIPGFEEQLIGMKPEEEKEIEVTFPEDYHVDDLKGAKTTFKVKVHEIKTKVLPEVDEEFIEELKIDGVKTLDELKAHIKENLTKTRQEENENKALDEVLDKVTKGATVEIPEVMIKNETDDMIKEYGQNLARQGFTLEQFYKLTGQSEENLRENMKIDAENRIKIRLILEKIAEVEGLEVTDEDINAEYETMANQYGLKTEDMKKYIAKDSLAYDLKMRKALEVVKS